MLNNTFIWNGISSEEFNIKIERFPTFSRPARKYTSASVPGKNGNIYDVQDAWEETSMSYQIFAGSSRSNTAEDFGRILEWLCEPKGYARLEDTYDVNHYREAVFLDAMDIENSWNRFGKAVIMFRCRPERFLKNQSNISLTFDSNGEAVLVNPTKHIAKPMITVGRGTAKGTLRINYVCVDIPGTTLIPNTAYIDCKNEDIYGTDGTSLNATAKVYPFGYNEDYGFLRLEPGSNTIVKSGGIGSVTLDTRFWEI